MAGVSASLVFLLAVAAGAIALQIFLSNKESRWPGFILPILSFGYSLMGLLAVAGFSVQTGGSTHAVNGVIVEQTAAQTGEWPAMIGIAAYVFALCNIPTAVLLAIYAACRDKRKRRRDLEKMSVQDLG
jgi:hypothetical protein